MTDAPNEGRWGNELLAAFPDAIQTHLNPYLSHAILAQGAICFDAGDVVRRVYFPMSGLISLLVSAGGDARVEAGMIGSEGAAGLQSAVGSRPSFTRAVVQVPGTFWSVAAEPLRQAVRGNDEAMALVSGYTELLWAEAQQLAACNVTHPALRRLARWLLQAADRGRSDRMPLTQEMLAEMIGVRRTSLTLLARHLQDRGVIKHGRGNVTVLDRAALEATACQCYQIIQRLYRRQSEASGARRAE
jgi:CRP-like cAMP-binding protein